MIPESQIADVRESLAGRAEEVCRHLLPGGRRKGRKWKVGNIFGTAGDSLEVELDGEKAGLWVDHTNGEGGDLITLWKESRGLNFADAMKEAGEFVNRPVSNEKKESTFSRYNYTYEEPPAQADIEAAVKVLKPDSPPAPGEGPPPPSPGVDWDKCVAAMNDVARIKVAGERGYSPDFVAFLAKEKLIGMHNGMVAFPVCDLEGTPLRAHVRTKKGWFYHPDGGYQSPLVVGDPRNASVTFVMESQWDAFAVLDVLGHHEEPGYYAAIITRGASANLDLARHLENAHMVVAIPQNDPAEKKDKKGKTPAENWLDAIKSGIPDAADFRVAYTPKEHKDANDWIRADSPERRKVEEVCINQAKAPDVRPFLTIGQLLDYPVEDDPNCVIGKRWLCRGGSFVIQGPSGAGKSTLLADMVLHWAVGDAWNGVPPVKPLKILVIQAENDEGDIAEMMRGAIAAKRKQWGAHLNQKMILANRNIRFCRIQDATGEDFCKVLERQIRFHKCDVVCCDPLLSFVGGDISKQEVASQFLRNWLNPVLERTGAIIGFIHHSGKPSTDAKSRSNWTALDYAYYGLGSSEVVNWARAICSVVPNGDGTFRFIFAKRGSRAGALNLDGKPTEILWLQQAPKEEGLIYWKQCREPEPPEEEEKPKRTKTSGDTVSPRIRATLDKLQWPLKWDVVVERLAALPEVGSESAAKDLLATAKKIRAIVVDAQGNYFQRFQ